MGRSRYRDANPIPTSPLADDISGGQGGQSPGAPRVQGTPNQNEPKKEPLVWEPLTVPCLWSPRVLLRLCVCVCVCVCVCAGADPAFLMAGGGGGVQDKNATITYFLKTK